jgi:hypothetical protein
MLEAVLHSAWFRLRVECPHGHLKFHWVLIPVRTGTEYSNTVLQHCVAVTGHRWPRGVMSLGHDRAEMLSVATPYDVKSVGRHPHGYSHHHTALRGVTRTLDSSKEQQQVSVPVTAAALPSLQCRSSWEWRLAALWLIVCRRRVADPIHK